MSTIATAALTPIDAVRPRAPLHGLLTVPGVLVDDAGRWEAGVAEMGWPPEMPDQWVACSEGTTRQKSEGDVGTWENFTSFAIYIPIQCSGMGVGDVEDFIERAEVAMQARRSWAVEKALSQGIAGLDNKWLGDADLDVLALDVSAGVGLSYLEDAIGQTGQQGLLHLTPAVAAALQILPIGDEAVTAPIYTGSGNHVSIGGGYIDTNPEAADGPGATSDWVFATLPVQVRISELDTYEDISEILDRSTNDVIYRAEQIAVVSWESALQVGVRVDWSL